MSNKHPLRQGEKILFGIVGVFFVLAVIGYAILEVVRITSDDPMFESKTSYDLSADGRRGSQVFRESQCTACHRAMRNGTNMGLSLDGVGSRRTVVWLESFLQRPEEMYPSATIDHGMPPKEAAYVSEMPREDLRVIAVFLSELKAEQGSSSSPLPPEGRSSFIDNMVKVFAPESWKEKYQDVRERSGQEQMPEVEPESAP